jgi:Putative beta-lactamase-inhibitor-like, PepSY-like
MKNSIKNIISTSLFAMMLIFSMASCTKDAVTPITTTATAAITNVVTDATTLAEAQNVSCQLPQSIKVADLPATITAYISSNFAGYTPQFVYAVQPSGTLTGYLVNLLNGTQHKEVRFDATGNYVKSLDLPAHIAGAFPVFQTDTIATTALPSSLQSYVTTNSTLAVSRIFMEKDSSYTVIATQNASTYALLYSPKTPTALSVINLGALDLTTANPSVSTLPSAVTDYISQNYNGASIERIMTGSCTGGNNTYTVVFKKDTTQYAAKFDATGTFIEVLQAN